jgi:hypothetical protein
MNDEFKKLSQGDVTRYVLESATSMGSSSIASIPMSMGGMQRRKGDNLIAQEADKKTVPASTPRNFVAKNAKSSGAGAHKDKKKEAKQGNVKHKKPYMEALQARLDQLKSKVAEGLEGHAGSAKVRYTGGMHGEYEPTKSQSSSQAHLDAAKYHDNEAGVLSAAMKHPKALPKDMDGYKNQIQRHNNKADFHRQMAGQQGVAEGSFGSGYGSVFTLHVNTGEKPATKTKTKKFKREDDAVLWAEDYADQHEMFPNLKMEIQDENGNVVWELEESQGVAEGSTTEKQILTRIRQIMYDRKLSGTESNAGELNRLKQQLKDMRSQQGVAEGFNGEYDDEAGMAQSNLITTARAVMGLLKTIKDRDNLPEWGQEKIAKAEMMLVSVWDYLQSQKAMGNDPQQGVAEGSAGLSKDAETNFHAKLDQLVHATFGKRKEEQDTDEDMSRRGFLKGAGAMVAGISAASGAHADNQTDPNKLIAIVNIDGESKEFNLTGRFKGDVKSQLHQAENFITEFLEKRDINFSNLELRYQGAVLKTQNTGSVRETSQLGELSIDTLRSYVPKRLNKAKDQISADPSKRNIEKAKKATTQDVPRAMTRLKDPAYGKQGVAEGSLNELSKDTLKSYSKERGATVYLDQRDASGARDMAADKKKHGDTTAAADWDDEASWLDKRAEKGAKGVAQATTKIAKKGMEEGDAYIESLQTMMERQLEPTMDLDAWNNNFQNADPQKYHQFKNKTPEKKK